jgi:HEAT repeat protein
VVNENDSPLEQTKKWISEVVDYDVRHAKGPMLGGDTWVERGKSIKDVDLHLLSLLNDEEDPYARSCMVVAFMYVGGKRDIESLIGILENDDSDQVKATAAAALGHLGDPSAIDALCTATHSENENVRGNAYVSLGKIGGQRAEVCIRVGATDSSSFVRQCAKTALEIMQSRKGK